MFARVELPSEKLPPQNTLTAFSLIVISENLWDAGVVWRRAVVVYAPVFNFVGKTKEMKK